jgi:tetratricopeptide (TPR) repeat protein
MFTRFYLIFLAFLAIAMQAICQPAGPKGLLKGDIDSTLARLLSVLDSNPTGMKWPPVIELVENDKPNAYAVVKNNQPTIILNSGITNVTQGIPDRLAYVIAHEMIHILKGHCNNSGLAGNGALENFFSRADEETADIEGFELLIKAGYSPREAVNTFKLIRKSYGDISPLEAQAVDHPSWTERLASIDKVQTKLWRSMSAFGSGTTLLMVQNYEAAIVCFEKVIKEFPTCFEAWANIGYARLMQYCDNLDEEDIAYFNIGQLVVGGFYRRPESLESSIRGLDINLWWNAIGNLKRALDINPDLSLVKSYLGIAYFLDPEKKSVGDSEKYMTEALRSVENDETIDPSLKACVYLNAGAIDYAKNDFTSAEKKMDEARSFQNRSKKDGSTKGLAGINAGGMNYSRMMNSALDYNQVMAEYKKNLTLNEADLLTLLRYLKRNDPASIWWKSAYTVYEAGTLKNNKHPLSREEIYGSGLKPVKPIESVIIDDFPVFLTRDIAEVLKRFPHYHRIPIVESRKIYQYLFPDQGIEILSGKDILGIYIKTDNSKIHLDSSSYEWKDIKIGMPWETVKSRFSNLDQTELTQPGGLVKYFFYSDIGIAFSIKESLISELIIVQKPFDENKLLP